MLNTKKIFLEEESRILKTVCFTGHRPNKLNGYNTKDNLELIRAMKEKMEWLIEEKGVTTFISGMAQGVDQWGAMLVLRMKKKHPHIKLVLAIPHAKQYSKWKDEKSILQWKSIFVQADERHYVSRLYFTSYSLQRRNEWMVDNSDCVLAIWNGDTVKCGTYNCIKYAKKKEKDIFYIDPKEYLQ